MRASRARAVVWLVLAAFVLQFTATRAHFHFAAAHEGIAVASAGTQTPGKVPLHDQANCPLFQAASVCGAALAGAAAVLAVQHTGTTPAVFALAVPHAERIAANWRSRAPPSL